MAEVEKSKGRKVEEKHHPSTIVPTYGAGENAKLMAFREWFPIHLSGFRLTRLRPRLLVMLLGAASLPVSSGARSSSFRPCFTVEGLLELSDCVDKVVKRWGLARKHLVFHGGVIRFPACKLLIGRNQSQAIWSQGAVIHPSIPEIDLAMGRDPVKEFEIAGRFPADTGFNKAV
jgi:hypothetical protein